MQYTIELQLYRFYVDLLTNFQHKPIEFLD
jgi:hypothetical protein